MRIAKTLAVSLVLASCQNGPAENEIDRRLQRMVDQDRCAADEPSSRFRNGACNQTPPVGVRAFGERDVSRVHTGRAADGTPLAQIPIAIGRSELTQGRQRFELFCATCHGYLGNGQSEVAENMRLRKPPALFDPVIAALPDGQIFRVISEGYGLMPSYASKLSVEERWAVVAYVRVLALSQSMPLALLSAREREEAAAWLR